MNTIMQKECRAESALQLLRNNWEMLQEWVRTSYSIASVDYKTEILPMSIEKVEITQDDKYEVKVKLQNVDKYLDTYVELRYAKYFSAAARELMGLECLFSFSSEGYKSKKEIFRKWIWNLSLTRTKQQEENKMFISEELKEAMALFMIKDISKMDRPFLKKQRNTLIKAFHPDEGEYDHEYAIVINNAYEVLLKYCR